MTPEDAKLITKLIQDVSDAHKVLIYDLMRSTAKFHAAELAFQTVLTELVEKRVISLEVAQILSKFSDYQEQHLSEALLTLEERYPDFAAELDRWRNEPSTGGENPSEDSFV